MRSPMARPLGSCLPMHYKKHSQVTERWQDPTWISYIYCVAALLRRCLDTSLRYVQIRSCCDLLILVSCQALKQANKPSQAKERDALRRIMIKLMQSSEITPTCLRLDESKLRKDRKFTGYEDKAVAVDNGSYAEVFYGFYGSTAVAIKRLKLTRRDAKQVCDRSHAPCD